MIIKCEDFDLFKIAESGQCFRMVQTDDGRYRVIAGENVLYLRDVPEGIEFSCSEAQFEAFWKAYFDLDTDYAAMRSAVDPLDMFLTRAADFGRGIRILRQDPWEMLITFIISQRRSIPSIRKSVELLCAKCGKPIEGDGELLFGFPSAEAVAALTDEELASCAFGYRTPYIRDTARMVARGRADLAAFSKADDKTLLELLMAFPGVGPKVANCVMLFGFHRLAGFPIDVWIQRVIDNEYGGEFPLARYDGFGGVVQQYMFFYARSAEYAASLGSKMTAK